VHASACVIVDVRMPDADGFALVESLAVGFRSS
jgi:FixJ family two-component response regulator